jgi:hypothetical protein
VKFLFFPFLPLDAPLLPLSPCTNKSSYLNTKADAVRITWPPGNMGIWSLRKPIHTLPVAAATYAMCSKSVPCVHRTCICSPSSVMKSR